MGLSLARSEHNSKSAHKSRKKTLLYTYLTTFGATFIGCSVRRGSYVHNLRKSQLYTQYLSSEGRLVLPLSVAEFGEVCTQFEEKTAIHLGTLVWTPDATLEKG